MAILSKVPQLSSCIIYVFIALFSREISCNPLAYGQVFGYPSSFQPVALQAPMMMSTQFDPYAAMQSQYMFTQPMNAMWPYDASRRSLPNMISRAHNDGPKSSSRDQNEPESDEERALEGIPPSLIEPERPSSLTERISESFSALNEGVKNHFRSVSENFSDTLDDIKDVWKPSESESKKRKS